MGFNDAVDALPGARLDAPVIETSYGTEDGGDAFEELLARDPRLTAVVCGNDVLAVGVMARARSLGLRVPEDVSVTGFDDSELAQIVAPPLTTVQVPHRDMGRIAALALLEMVEGKSAVMAKILETRLQMRASLGAAPASGHD